MHNSESSRISKSGAGGRGGTGQKLCLVLVLSARYETIGWLGPRCAGELVAFHTMNPLLLAALVVATVRAIASGTIIAALVLSRTAGRERRVSRGRAISGPPAALPVPRVARHRKLVTITRGFPLTTRPARSWQLAKPVHY